MVYCIISGFELLRSIQSPCQAIYNTKFKGDYFCPQGKTTVVFVIYYWPTKDNPYGLGTMVFMPHDDSVHTCYGMYKVNIKIDSEGHVEMIPIEWLENPCNYIMVGFKGELLEGGEMYNGVVTHQSCQFFETSLWDK